MVRNAEDLAALRRALNPRPASTVCEPVMKGPKPPPRRTGQLRAKARKTGTRPTAPWSTDADYRLACEIVDLRSGGVCEHCRTEPATNHHHVAGRGFAGCHHPLLLKHLCGNGNVDGCHGLAHSLPMRTAAALGLRLPWGTRVDEDTP